jgi:predicted dehydrogenase
MLETDRLREKPCTHAGTIVRNRECELVGGCDIDGERCRLFTRRYGCPNVKIRMEDMLETSPVQILHVATPPETHLELIVRSLAYNPAVVVCEKPLASNEKEACRIAELHDSERVRIVVNHERRYSWDYRMARQRIERRIFGDLLSVEGRLYMGQKRPVGETLLHDGTHMIDAIRFLTSSELTKRNVDHMRSEAAGTLMIGAEAGGVPVRIEIGSGRDYVQFELDLSFSRGRIRIGNGLYEEYESRKSPFYEGMRSLMRSRIKRPRMTGYFSNMLVDAIQCLRDPQHRPVSSALDGYAAVRFIESVKREVSDESMGKSSGLE